MKYTYQLYRPMMSGFPALDEKLEYDDDKKEDADRDQDRAPMVTVTKDGPYAITGGIELADQPRGEGASTEHYTLCRCGGSKNKPFCDGTHWQSGFKDENN